MGSSLDPHVIMGKVQQTALSALLSEYPAISSSDVRISVKSRQDMAPPNEAKSWKLELSANTHFLGTTILPLVYFDQAHSEIKRMPLIFQIQAKGHFVKATRVIRKEEILTTSNIEDSLEDIEGKPFVQVPSYQKALGKQVVMTIAKGAFILDSLIKQVPVIKQGGKILIILKKQNVELKFKGEALQDGQKGSRIKVKSALPDHKVLEGEVIDAETVEVRLLD